MSPGDLVRITADDLFYTGRGESRTYIGLYLGPSPELPGIFYTESRFIVGGEVWDVPDELHRYEVIRAAR